MEMSTRCQIPTARGLHQVMDAVEVDPGSVGVAGAVDDHRHVGDRGGEPAAADELAGYPPDGGRGAGGAGSAAEHPDLVAAGQEPVDHAAAEGAAAAGDQDWLVHGQDLPVRLDTGR